MCEILLRVASKVNEKDVYLDTKLTKRGDVIVVKEDGWMWGKEELTNPDWRILCLPHVTVSDASAWLAPEFDTDPTQPSKTLQRRQFRLDIDSATFDGIRVFLDDASRTAPMVMLHDTKGAADAAVAEKLADPKHAEWEESFSSKGIPTEKLAVVSTDALSAEDIHASVVMKEPVKDPAVIGDNPAVIG